MNTASRMESSSEPNRIHCSDRSAALLKKQQPPGMMRIKSRGMTDIKGKGQLKTYWYVPGSPSVCINSTGPRMHLVVRDLTPRPWKSFMSLGFIPEKTMCTQFRILGMPTYLLLNLAD